METIKQKLPAIKKFVFEVLDSLLVLLLGVLGLVLIPAVCVLIAVILGLIWGILGFVAAVKLAFSEVK